MVKKFRFLSTNCQYNNIQCRLYKKIMLANSYDFYFNFHVITRIVLPIFRILFWITFFLTNDFIFGQIGSIGYPEKLEEIHEIEDMAMVEDVVSRQAIAQRC